MSTYETEDEYDVAQGIVDALSLKLPSMTGAEWLGWEISDASLGEIEITANGKRYLVTVEEVGD